MGKIRVNWVRTSKGNGIKEGSILRVNASGAAHVSGAIYKNGYPVIGLFGYGQNARDRLKRSKMSLKGRALLKIRAFDKYGRGFGIDDIFEVF